MTTCGSGAGAGVGSLAQAIAPSARHSARPGIAIQARRKFSCIWMYLRHGRFVDRFPIKLWPCKTCVMRPTANILHILIYSVKYSIASLALPRNWQIIPDRNARLICARCPGCQLCVISDRSHTGCTLPGMVLRCVTGSRTSDSARVAAIRPSTGFAIAFQLLPLRLRLCSQGHPLTVR